MRIDAPILVSSSAPTASPFIYDASSRSTSDHLRILSFPNELSPEQVIPSYQLLKKKV